MKRLCVLVAIVWLGVGMGSAQAQFSWNPFRKAAPQLPPAERVAQLITTVKSDPDERKRTNAVEDLRDFDIKLFPEIVPILADAAQNDAKPGVRAEAVNSLVRIRPVTPAAGQAIEYVAAKDDHWRNRMNAQAALVRYRLAGYSSSGAAAARNDAKPPTPGSTASAQSQEPPLGERPPIIYHDSTGKVIPAPKGMPTQGYPGPNPVIGTPTSNPNGKTKSPFAPIGPANAPPPANFTPQPMPSPLPPAQVTVPPAVEPVFRNVNKLPTNPQPGPLMLTPPPAPSAVPNIVPALPTATPIGPSLDLPPLPINNAPAPTSPAPFQGPSLDTTSTPAPSLVPSGRMEPSPRLSPATNDPAP